MFIRILNKAHPPAVQGKFSQIILFKGVLSNAYINLQKKIRMLIIIMYLAYN